MKKEEFVALGISEELAEKAASASSEELKRYVPKTRFDEVNTEKNQLKTAKEEAETQLEQLKESAGDNEALRNQITDLQNAAKQKDADHAAEIKALRMSNAIRAAIGNTAQDADLVAGLIDQGKLILGEDGKLTGLDEQVKALKESKPFLFKEEKPAGGGAKGGFRVGSVQGGTAGGVGAERDQISMRDAIAAKLQANGAGNP